jgi:hypothetical protein
MRNGQKLLLARFRQMIVRHFASAARASPPHALAASAMAESRKFNATRLLNLNKHQ